MPVKSFLPQTGQTISCSAMNFFGPAVAGLRTLGEVFDQFVGTEPGLTGFAVHQGVVEATHMAAGNPDFPIHQNRTVQTGVVLAFLYKFLPPGLFNVILEFHTQGAVVPGVGQSAVDLGSGKDKSAVFAQGNQLVHREFSHDQFPPVSCGLKSTRLLWIPGLLLSRILRIFVRVRTAPPQSPLR